MGQLARYREVGVRPFGLDSTQRLQRDRARIHVPRRSPSCQCTPLAHARAGIRGLAFGLHLDELDRLGSRGNDDAVAGRQRGAPHLQALAVVRRPRVAEAHEPVQLDGGLRPVELELGRDRSCGRTPARRIAAPACRVRARAPRARASCPRRRARPAARRRSRPDRWGPRCTDTPPPVSRPSSMSMMQTPVRSSPARMARSNGAAPRHRGSSEKCTLIIGTASSTGGLIKRP